MIYSDIYINDDIATQEYDMQDNPQEALRLAYYAGLFDGEGSFCICRQPSKTAKDGHENIYHHPLVRIGMTDGWILKEIHEFFGVGNFYCEGVRKDRPTYKTMYRWNTGTREGCYEVILKLLPYLRVKKTQAELVLQFCKVWQNALVRKYVQDPEILRQREELFRKVKQLNHTGAPAETEYRGHESASDSPIPEETLGEGNNKTLRLEIG
jgi:hypothetical protein